MIDVNFPNVKLRLMGTGSLVDVSSNSRAASSFGTATISSEQSKWGTTSIKFTGAGNQITYPYSADFNFGAGAFTIKFWIRLTSVSVVQVICTNYQNSTNGWAIAVTAGGNLSINLSGDAYDIIAAGAITAGTWAFVELSGQTGSIKAFVNGVVVGTFTGSTVLDTTAPFTIGGLIWTGAWYDRVTGYINDFSIIKGVAENTSNYTPPTRPSVAGYAEVTGTVRDDTGALCARRVVLIDRSTGAAITTTSDATTGVYLLAVQTLDEATVVVLDDAAGTAYTDLIARVQPG